MTSKGVKDRLRSSGLRVTAAREAVYSCLEHCDAPLSHADVVEALNAESFDRATLYRNLIDLVEAKLVTRQHFGDHVWRFSLVPHDAFHHEHDESKACCEAANPHRYHPHYICDTCHSVRCYTNSMDLHALLGEDLPHVREVLIRGVCKGCR